MGFLPLRYFVGYLLVVALSVLAFAYVVPPMGFAPDHGPVRTQPICNPDNPQPGCVPLHKLT